MAPGPLEKAGSSGGRLDDDRVVPPPQPAGVQEPKFSDPEGGRSTPSVGPTPSSQPKVINVLYLFAGQKRRADVHAHLKQLGLQHSVIVNLTEIDVARQGKKGDLLSRRRRAENLARISIGFYHAILISPLRYLQPGPMPSWRPPAGEIAKVLQGFPLADFRTVAGYGRSAKVNDHIQSQFHDMVIHLG